MGLWVIKESHSEVFADVTDDGSTVTVSFAAVNETATTAVPAGH